MPKRKRPAPKPNPVRLLELLDQGVPPRTACRRAHYSLTCVRATVYQARQRAAKAAQRATEARIAEEKYQSERQAAQERAAALAKLPVPPPQPPRREYPADLEAIFTHHNVPSTIDRTRVYRQLKNLRSADCIAALLDYKFLVHICPGLMSDLQAWHRKTYPGQNGDASDKRSQAYIRGELIRLFERLNIQPPGRTIIGSVLTYCHNWQDIGEIIRHDSLVGSEETREKFLYELEQTFKDNSLPLLEQPALPTVVRLMESEQIKDRLKENEIERWINNERSSVVPILDFPGCVHSLELKVAALNLSDSPRAKELQRAALEGIPAHLVMARWNQRQEQETVERERKLKRIDAAVESFHNRQIVTDIHGRPMVYHGPDRLPLSGRDKKREAAKAEAKAAADAAAQTARTAADAAAKARVITDPKEIAASVNEILNPHAPITSRVGIQRALDRILKPKGDHDHHPEPTATNPGSDATQEPSGNNLEPELSRSEV